MMHTIDRWARRGAASLALALALGAGLGACSGEATGAGPRRLEGSVDSLDELGRTAFAALAVGDAAGLERLRLTGHEHNEIVWPKLPAARPEVNYPVDLAWANIQTRNRAAVGRLIPHFRERRHELVRTECRGDVRRFDGFRVRTDCYLVVREAGTTRELQVFEEVLVMGREHKIFRYSFD